MHSPTFPSTFSSKFLMYICVGTLTNIYFNMKDSDHLDKCNFPFLHMRKSRVFIWFSLQIYYFVSRGSGACLGPRSWRTFNCQICILTLFLVLFLQKINFHLCRHIAKYLFQYVRFWPFWQICSLKLILFTDTLVCKPMVRVPLGGPRNCLHF